METKKRQSNVKHQCPFCKKNNKDTKIFKSQLSDHFFSHEDELKAALTHFASYNNHLRRFPVSILGFEICLVSRKVWKKPLISTGKSWSRKHFLLPEYNAENQTAALYEYLNITAPEKPVLTIEHSANKDRDVKMEMYMEESVKWRTSYKELLENTKLSLGNCNSCRVLKRDNQNALDLIKTKLMDDVEVRNELIKVMWQFIPVTQISMVQKAISEITNDEEKLNKIKDLSTRLINTEYDISMSVSEPAPEPAPEPALVPERARVPEPPPTSIETPPPEPDQEPESESESMHEPEPQQVKQKTRNNTCNIAGCGDSQHGHYFKCTSCLSTACNENDITHCYKFECEICNTPLCKICMKKYGSKLHIRCKNHQRNLDAITAQPVEPVKILSSQQQLFLNQNFRFQQGYRDEPINIIGKKPLVSRIK